MVHCGVMSVCANVVADGGCFKVGPSFLQS